MRVGRVSSVQVGLFDPIPLRPASEPQSHSRAGSRSPSFALNPGRPGTNGACLRQPRIRRHVRYVFWAKRVIGFEERLN